MDKLWKWVMHLNAKAFCFAAFLFFAGVALFCFWLYAHPPAPLKDGKGDAVPELPPASEIGMLNFVTNQLASESLTIPVDPFRPTVEAIFTNETERAAFLKALRAAQAAAAGLSGSGDGGSKKEDPFAHLRKRDAVPDGLVGANGQPMVIPKLSFLGFFKRPDGTQSAMFHDSVENSTVFYDAGQKIHGVDVLSANLSEAEIRFPDGTTRKLPIGESVELAAEPDKNPPKKVVPVKPAAAAAAGKPGALAGKPGAAAKNAGQQQQRGAADPQQRAALQKKAAQQKAQKREP